MLFNRRIRLNKALKNDVTTFGLLCFLVELISLLWHFKYLVSNWRIRKQLFQFSKKFSRWRYLSNIWPNRNNSIKHKKRTLIDFLILYLIIEQCWHISFTLIYMPEIVSKRRNFMNRLVEWTLLFSHTKNQHNIKLREFSYITEHYFSFGHWSMAVERGLLHITGALVHQLWNKKYSLVIFNVLIEYKLDNATLYSQWNA